MFSVVIRGNIEAEDEEITADTREQLRDKVATFVSGLEISDHYLYNRLVNCSKDVPALAAGHCPRIFDSWSCFDSAPPDTVQLSPCPEFPALKFATQRFAYKYCDAEGGWWVHPDSNRTWSNYTSCIDWEDLNFRVLVNSVSVAGLVISILFLAVSIVIFKLGPGLQCGRVTVHTHLCVSLLASNLAWLVWHYAVLGQHEVWSTNSVWCRAVNTATTFLTMTNYAWMLAEGAFLHFLLVLPFLQEARLVRLLRLLGWLAPGLCVLPYAVYRSYHENYHCWMDQGDSNWFLGVPVILTIVLNVYFLTRVLIIQRAKLKAAMFLIPILGINFLLLPIRPEDGSSFEYLYDIISTVFSSFQGVWVSCLLCFANGQVKELIKNKLKMILEKNVNHQAQGTEMTLVK